MAKPQTNAVTANSNYDEQVMNAFNGMNDPKSVPTQDGVPVLPGRYICETEGCKLHKSNKDGILRFIANLRVVQSDNPERPAGSNMDWVMPITDPYRETKLGAIRGYVAASLVVPVEDVKQQHMPEVCGPKQILVGSRVKVWAKETTKKNGQPFTKCMFNSFNPANDNGIADIEDEEAPF